MPANINLSDLTPQVVVNDVTAPRIWTKSEYRDGTRPAPPANILYLDTFNAGTNRTTDPTDTPAANTKLWSEYADFRPDAVTQVLEAAAKEGAYGIANTINTITGGVATSQFQFRPKYGSFDIRYMRECLESGTWQLDHYNRMSFWIKTPANQGLVKATGGGENFHFGTYTRSTSTAKSTFESDNGHWYHQYNLPHLGTWHKVIVDWHPSHQRSLPGSTEHGEKQYPTSEDGYNYFDLLTRFYMQVNPNVDAEHLPMTIYYDDFRVYRDTNNENVAEIYCLHGGYRASDNLISVGWNRLKTLPPTAEFEVCYSFQSVHEIGWDNATPAPSGIFQVGGWEGSNRVNYETTAIDVSGQTSIFIAMRPVGSTLFREIEVELDIGD